MVERLQPVRSLTVAARGCFSGGAGVFPMVLGTLHHGLFLADTMGQRGVHVGDSAICCFVWVGSAGRGAARGDFAAVA
jgi:hypothetical protein